MITWRKLPQFMGRQFRYPGGDRFRTRINLQCTQFPQLLGLYASLETMKALPRLYNTYSRNSISFTAAQILRVWGLGCGCSFPRVVLFPHIWQGLKYRFETGVPAAAMGSDHSLYHRGLWNKRILCSKSRPENNWIRAETIKNYRKPLKKVSYGCSHA